MEENNNRNNQGSQQQGPFPAFLSIVLKNFSVIILIGLVIYFVIPQIASLQKNIVVVKSLKAWAVALALAMQITSYLGSGLTIKALVKSAHRYISTVKSMIISLSSYSIGLVAGGMFGSAAATFRWVKANGGGNQGASLSATIPPILIDLVLLGISIIGVLQLFFKHNLTALQITAFLFITLLLFLVTLAIFLGLKFREKFKELGFRFVKWLYGILKKPVNREKIFQEFDRLYRTWDTLLKGGWKGPLLGAAITVIFDMMTIYFVFLGIGMAIPLDILITGYGLPILFGKMAFIIPGGIGVIETTMIALYTSLGIPFQVSSIVVLVYRFISFWTPLLTGFVLIPFAARVPNSTDKMIP
jgi:uncharacterized protein (TIRG00374 family)